MPRRTTSPRPNDPFLLAMRLLRDDVPSFDVYPFSLPVVRGLHELPLDVKVTFLIGENGSGKSTLHRGDRRRRRLQPGGRQPGQQLRDPPVGLRAAPARAPRSAAGEGRGRATSSGPRASTTWAPRYDRLSRLQGRLRDPAGLRRSFTARAIPRRILSRRAQEPLRPEWSLRPTTNPRPLSRPQRQLALAGANAPPGRRTVLSSSSRRTLPFSWPSPGPDSSASTANGSSPWSTGAPSTTR